MTKNDAAKQVGTSNSIKPRRFLMVEAENRPGSFNLELSADLPIRSLFPMLITTLGWRLADEEKTIPYRMIAIKDGHEIELKGSDTLISADIPSGSTLRIMTGKPSGTKAISNQETALFIPATENVSTVVMSNSHQDRQSNMAASRRVQPVKEPSLISSSGVIFPIRGKEVWVGRPDKNYHPEINLAEEDENDTCSRHHAQIFNEDGKFILRPRPTLNLTFVNGIEIRQNENYALKEGDLVRFGDVELIFRLP